MTEQTQSLDVQQEHQKFIEDLGDWTRSHNCGQLTLDNDGQTVCLMGWVQYRRDHGGLIFVDLRDREGLTQVVFSPDIAPAAHENAHILRSEYVLAIKGVVRPRPEGMTNPNLVTGAIEVVVHEWKLLNTSKTPPFAIEERCDAGENLRLAWRYLDLLFTIYPQSNDLPVLFIIFVKFGLEELSFLNALCPILVTLLGIVTLVNLLE